MEEVESTPGVVLAVTKRGGHLGFLSASKTWGSAWMDDVVLQFIQAAMTTTPQEKVAISYLCADVCRPTMSMAMFAVDCGMCMSREIDRGIERAALNKVLSFKPGP